LDWVYLALKNTAFDLRVPYSEGSSSSGWQTISFSSSTSIQHRLIYKSIQYLPLTFPPHWVLWRSLPIFIIAHAPSFTCVAL